MYQRILVPVDGSKTSDCGLEEAVRLASMTGARLRLVHVVDGPVFSTGMEFITADVYGLLIEAGAQVLSEAKAKVESAGIAVDTFLSEAFGERVCDVVLAQVKLWNADLIVIGTHGRRGVGRLLIGSDAEQILRAAPVPVLLVRPKTQTSPQRQGRAPKQLFLTDHARSSGRLALLRIALTRGDDPRPKVGSYSSSSYSFSNLSDEGLSAVQVEAQPAYGFNDIVAHAAMAGESLRHGARSDAVVPDVDGGTLRPRGAGSANR